MPRHAITTLLPDARKTRTCSAVTAHAQLGDTGQIHVVCSWCWALEGRQSITGAGLTARKKGEESEQRGINVAMRLQDADKRQAIERGGRGCCKGGGRKKSAESIISSDGTTTMEECLEGGRGAHAFPLTPPCLRGARLGDRPHIPRHHGIRCQSPSGKSAILGIRVSLLPAMDTSRGTVRTRCDGSVQRGRTKARPYKSGGRDESRPYTSV